MGKKLIILALIVSVLGVVGIAFASASGDLSGPTTIRFRAITDQQNFLDLGAAGPSQGDAFIFHDVLKHEGRTIGHDGGTCTLTDATVGEAQCLVTISLAGGQITSQGLNVAPPSGEFVATFPVTGGSGIYRNVGGQVVVDQISATVARIKVSLIVP